MSGIQILSHDTTARREQERQQRELAAAIEHTPFSVLVMDAAGIITFANPGFQAVTGFDRSEAIGRAVGDLVRSGVHEESFYRAVDETLRAGRVWTGRLVNRRKDGSIYQEEKTIAPISRRGR